MKKKVPVTATSPKQRVNATVITSTSGAKVIKDFENTKKPFGLPPRCRLRIQILVTLRSIPQILE